MTWLPKLPASQKPVALVWIRRALRLKDNPALYFALQQTDAPVAVLFILDKQILDPLPKEDKRVFFIYEQLKKLDQSLKAHGSRLLVGYGDPLQVLKQLAQQLNISALHTHNDYEPYAQKRDQLVADFCKKAGVLFQSYQDHVLFEPNQLLKANKKPYTVFTPYMKQWKKLFQPKMTQPFHIDSSACKRLMQLPATSDTLPAYSAIGFTAPKVFPKFPAPTYPIERLKAYANQRNLLAGQHTSELGIHLRFGVLSIREATAVALKHSDAWLNQLIWRNFYISILAHYPHVVDRAFKPAYDNIPWAKDLTKFEAWCAGKTGFPAVDAGMRQLNQTGMMHNRARLIAANFLTKCLLIHWQWGEAYFAGKLLDFELASNNGNWQWSAGSGCDAAPYFRIFNPDRQLDRFDPEKKYIKQWLPEYGTANYPKPIIDYTWARQRALDIYKKHVSAGYTR